MESRVVKLHAIISSSVMREVFFISSLVKFSHVKMTIINFKTTCFKSTFVIVQRCRLSLCNLEINSRQPIYCDITKYFDKYKSEYA